MLSLLDWKSIQTKKKPKFLYNACMRLSSSTVLLAWTLSCAYIRVLSPCPCLLCTEPVSLCICSAVDLEYNLRIKVPTTNNCEFVSIYAGAFPGKRIEVPQNLRLRTVLPHLYVLLASTSYNVSRERYGVLVLTFLSALFIGYITSFNVESQQRQQGA